MDNPFTISTDFRTMTVGETISRILDLEYRIGLTDRFNKKSAPDTFLCTIQEYCAYMAGWDDGFFWLN